MAQRREVERRWNRGETAPRIAQALRLSVRSVYSMLARLRLEGRTLRAHDQGRPQRQTAPDPDVLRTLGEAAPSVVTVYDARGRAIAQIDPHTRQRRALG